MLFSKWYTLLPIFFQADIWKIPNYLNSTLDLHINADNVEKIVSELKSIGTEFSTLIEDLQK